MVNTTAWATIVKDFQSSSIDVFAIIDISCFSMKRLPCAPVWWWSRSPGNAGPCGAQPRGKRNVEIERILQSFWDFPHFWIWSSELPNSLQRISLRLFQTFCQKNFNITKHSQVFQATKRCPRTNESPQRLSSSQKTRTSLRGMWTSLRTSLKGKCSSCFSREQV